MANADGQAVPLAAGDRRRDARRQRFAALAGRSCRGVGCEQGERVRLFAHFGAAKAQ